MQPDRRTRQPTTCLTAGVEGRNYEIGRLGEGNSVFDHRRVQFSITEQARRTAGKDAKKAVINRLVRQAITERRHAVIFTTYMKSAELNGTNTLFILADEAGQATEPTSAALLANAVDGGHAMIVGGEHQLAPTVRDQCAEWDGLGCSLLARLNRNRKGLKHLVILEIQYRMHPDIQLSNGSRTPSTVGFHNFSLRNFIVRVSNPKKSVFDFF